MHARVHSARVHFRSLARSSTSSSRRDIFPWPRRRHVDSGAVFRVRRVRPAACQLSAMLVMRFGGEVPRELAELESLPGVGHKTASVVRSQCFGLPAMPVDTHIHRLAARWGLSDGRNVDQTERDLMQVFDEKDWNAIHLQIIFYGREHGKAGQSWPYPGPICSWAGLEDAPATTPAMKRKKRKQEHVGDDDAR